jgi:RNA polymerase sigma factor (sigma-70 family)
LAAVSPVGRATGLEPLGLGADAHLAGTLYEDHSRRVFAYCLSKLGRREDAEDAVQTTFLHAVRGLRRGVVPSVELAWLLGIARNVCLARRESAGRRGRLELVCDPVDLERAPARQGRGDELIGLEDALARLPEHQRQAVLLRDWRGLSYEEVAAQLGVSLANAETLIFRGRRTLAALLQEQPSATRRRLGSLANLGSLFTAIKTAFTGAATVAKIAAAVTVVAASGGGIAAGTVALDRRDSAPTAPTRAQVPEFPTPASADAVPGKPRAAAPAPSRSLADPAAPTAASPTKAAPSAPAASPPASAQPNSPAASPTSPSPSPSPAPSPAPAAAAPRTLVPFPAPQPTVQATVDEVLPELPVPVPPLPEVLGSLPVPALPVETPPAVETVVEALPTVTVTTPLDVLPPVTIDPRRVLP